MKNLLRYCFIFIACFSLIACKPLDNGLGPGGEDIDDSVDIFDFRNITQAPKTRRKQDVDKVIKVFFMESSMDEALEAVAIDIDKNEIHRYSNIGIGTFSGLSVVSVNNTSEVKDIIEKYDVQDWKTSYSFEDHTTYDDGYGWSLWLQFEDGKVKKSSGSGSGTEEITPENFDDFAEELYRFKKSKLIEAGEEELKIY